jgi:hypothetical protein
MFAIAYANWYNGQSIKSKTAVSAVSAVFVFGGVQNHLIRKNIFYNDHAHLSKGLKPESRNQTLRF